MPRPRTAIFSRAARGWSPAAPALNPAHRHIHLYRSSEAARQRLTDYWEGINNTSAWCSLFCYQPTHQMTAVQEFLKVQTYLAVSIMSFHSILIDYHLIMSVSFTSDRGGIVGSGRQLGE